MDRPLLLVIDALKPPNNPLVTRPSKALHSLPTPEVNELKPPQLASVLDLLLCWVAPTTDAACA